jgi:hypothetical protein
MDDGVMVAAIKNGWATRTFKREVAVVLLLFWAGITTLLTLKMTLWATDPAMITAIGTAFGPIHSSITTMVLTFAGFAFGLDAMSKQLGMGQKP